MRLRSAATIPLLLVATLLAGTAAFAQASSIPESRLMEPEELVQTLKSSSAEKPLIIQVGFEILYSQGHIPGAEYIGPASKPEGIARLRDRLHALPRNKFIVIYCGCCPWSHCPNVHPAAELLSSMGFTNFKVLHIVDNFGADWARKGYPTAKGN